VKLGCLSTIAQKYKRLRLKVSVGYGWAWIDPARKFAFRDARHDSSVVTLSPTQIIAFKKVRMRKVESCSITLGVGRFDCAAFQLSWSCYDGLDFPMQPGSI
jgi:hypothetical protein